jgi:uncharacterized protein YhaN
MKITDLDINGFGVWRDLKISNLSRRITAFYGPNEAGKSTMMQFVRGILYGMSPARRKRYLPPVEGGEPGGALGISDGELQFRCSRIADRGPDDYGRVICTMPDGSTSGDRLLKDALNDVDEPTFTNVFAIGLDEVHELGALGGAKAAEWLYRLTSGLDRVSLYDVIQNLGAGRHELLSSPGKPSRIVDLTAQRDKLRSEIDQLREQNRIWSQLAVRIKELDEQIATAEADVRKAEHSARTFEIAVGLKPNWRKREKLNEQLAHLSGRVKLSDDAVERLNAINADVEKHQRQADTLAGQRHQLRDEADRLGVNELLVRNASRIEALGEQRDWLQSLQRQREDLEREARGFENRLSAEQKRLGEALGLKEGTRLRELTETDLESLQPHIDGLRLAQKRLDQAQRDLDMLTESERSLRTQIETAIIGGESHKLPMDLDEAGNLVAQLRKRLQVEQRLQQAREHEVELEQQSHDLLDDQVMPLWLFGWLFAMVVLGALMVGVKLIVPNSPLGNSGGLVALTGLGIALFAWVFKYFADDAAAEKLDACQRQMEVIAKQVADAEREKAAVDAELPLTDGSVVLRLQAAERHLAELEGVLPVEAQRKQAGGEVQNAEARFRQVQRERDGLLANWKSTVVALGLPESLDAQRLLTVTERYGQLAELESRARHRREDAALRQREYETLLRRIADLAEEVGCVLDPATQSYPRIKHHAANRDSQAERSADRQQRPVQPTARDNSPLVSRDAAAERAIQPERPARDPESEVDALAQLDHLLSERRRQLGDVERREQLAVRAREFKTEEAKHLQSIAAFKRRRAAMFQAAGCEDEQAFRMMAADQHQAVMLGQQRDAVSREILAAIGRHETEETFAKLLDIEVVAALESQWERAAADLEGCQKRLKEFAGQRGELKREQALLAEDRSLAERQLDLSIVEQQLASARDRWREHAAMSRVLERIRADYEQHRQPETLSEASRYMAKLTNNQYRRIWTPLAQDVLLVDNAEGQSLPVDVLSRGTREQLFLSVRLALVATFARRGINLPMVLDDVFVNFDVGRQQRAAEVLSEFAAAGHQLLFFTCHEHIWHMLQALDADCRRIPTRRGAPEPALPAPKPVIETRVDEPAPAPKRAPAKKRPRSRPEPVLESASEWYDYPFVERLVVEEVRAPIVAAAKLPPASPWHEYSFEPAEYSVPTADEPDDHALAYIVSAEKHPRFAAHSKRASSEQSRASTERAPSERVSTERAPGFIPGVPPHRTIIGDAHFRNDRDHLKPRRA